LPLPIRPGSVLPVAEPTEPELGILRVELLDESLKTYRLENGNDSAQFPVHLWFTRSLDVYERAELAKHGYEVDFVVEDDNMRAIVIVTAETFGQVVEGLHKELPAVASDAKQAQTDAKAEDEHLGALVQQINLTINPQ
jgi:hypothetical protein